MYLFACLHALVYHGIVYNLIINSLVLLLAYAEMHVWFFKNVVKHDSVNFSL